MVTWISLRADTVKISTFGYENSGAGSFTKHVIATQNGAHAITAVDMDEDGDLDLVTAGQGRRFNCLVRK